MLAFWLVPCYAKVMAAKVHQFQKTPSGFRVADVTIRLARPDERARWDAIMDQRHYLGFKRFAGRGLRYVFEWHGHWLGLAGWQSGAFKCGPRDRWVGWKRGIQFARLHLISNNTRFLILGEPGCFPNLASFALAGMTRRLSADWYAAWGHELLLAKTFVDPSRFCGHMYAAAGWTRLGRTKGFARASGKYTDPHGVPKDLHVFPLRRDARRRMREPCDLADGLQPSPMGRMSALPSGCLRSLYDELLRVPDFRRAQGRKHTIASVLAIFIAARLAGITSGIGAAQYARALNQTELQALGAWRNKKTGRFEPPSKSVLYRVLEMADPAEIEAVLKRFSAPRLSIGAAIASDGKRIRGANRNGEGHHETATLVEHETGLPVASHGFHDESGEIAAVQALLEDVSVAGRVITVDALHTVRDTARSIVETHKADYLMTVKANAPETFATLETINWEGSVSEVYAWAADCCGEAGPRRCPPDHADEMEPSQIAVQVLRGDAAIAAQETLQLAVAAIDRLNVEGIPDPLSGRKVQGFVANAHGRSAGRIAAMTVRNQNDVGIQNRFEHRLQGLGVDRRKNLADGCAAAIGGDQDRHLFIRQAALAGLAATLARLAIQSARSLVALKHVSLVNFDNALEFRPILACGLQETVPPAEGRIDAKSASTGRFPYRLALGQRHAE